MFLVVDPALLSDSRSWSAPFDELVDLEGDGRWRGRIRGEVRFVVAASRVYLSGRLAGFVPRECHLCLGHYLEPVEAELAEIAEVLAGGPAEGRFDDDDEVWRVGLEGRLDITEMVRQTVLLALPTRAECHGCPRPADSQAAPARDRVVDPRLAVLEGLLERKVNDGGPEETNQ